MGRSPVERAQHMTNNNIDQMWNQAMDETVKNGENFTRYRFADLVAAAEREACAKLCEAQGEYGWQQYADAIRARGNT